MISNAGYNRFIAVTPSNTDDLALFQAKDRRLTDGIYVGGGGNLVAVMEDGSTVTFTGALIGTILPIQARRINASSTTASLLVALYKI